MHTHHTPAVDTRYWVAILLASIFGTNLGDLYAHESGLGIVAGLSLLAAVAGLAFVLERKDQRQHQVWYWLVIIVIRTGATNIADYLAFRLRLNMIGLCMVLAGVIAGLAVWQKARVNAAADATGAQSATASVTLPDTNASYWLAMLAAGVFGTVLGDVCSHELGGGVASMLLSAILLATLLISRNRGTQTLYGYWLVVAVARTAGTAVGDWFAETEMLHIGLPVSTVVTGIAFVVVLLCWPRRTAST